MAHFLTTDWTHKIKTNPVANMILNSNQAKNYRVTLRELRAVPGKGKLMTDAFLRKYLSPEYVRDEIVDSEGLEKIRNAYATPSQRQEAHNKIILASRGGAEVEMKDDDDVGIVAVGGAAGRVVKVDDNDFSDAVEYDSDDEIDGEDILLSYEQASGSDMWANTYVDDYINIHHPKIRHDYVSALTGKPLQIKPPSVFFSDL